ncbi:hypothetical protein DV451_000879 [Geotrichum candidum]|uniref:Major facilitator superfamily (MFS) profile domain-containing protein n=1 Tax=Geotrichum candidum TaxID=1173061 RepID=A0A9P5KU56_GEOCN|nr:hypothetical protein DV451_000879 [Geotrichum candidum]
MRYPIALLRAPAAARFTPVRARCLSTKDNSYKIVAATEVPQATESLRAAGWSVVGAQLSKTYEFKGFQATWVAMHAHLKGHHPHRPSPSYWTLPRKDQILLLVLCKLTEPLALTSISPYLYYMIHDFGYTDPAAVSFWDTLVTSAYPFGSALSGFVWGRFSDIRGRKAALLLGTTGTLVSTLAFGLSPNVYMAVASRFFAGLLSGNNGVMKTAIAEIIGSRTEYQSRAFAIIPMTFNIGNIIGPVLGGFLADPVHNHPDSFVGGIKLFEKFPYLLPNLALMPILASAVIAAFLFIEETGDTSAHSKLFFPRENDIGLKIGDRIRSTLGISIPTRTRTTQVEQWNSTDNSKSTSATTTTPLKAAPPLNIFTRAVRITLTCYVILMLHAPTVLQLFSLYLATPHTTPSGHAGGLGWPAARIGMLMSLLGIAGITLQLTAYPLVAGALGNAAAHKLALYIFPVTYVAIPLLSSLPVRAQGAATAAAVVLGVSAVLARTFALPPMAILLTNAAPSRAVLGAVNGVAQSATAASKCIGPFVAGNLYSLGLRIGAVGLAWWALAAVVIIEIYVTRALEEWDTENLFKADAPEPDSAEETEPLVSGRSTTTYT